MMLFAHSESLFFVYSGLLHKTVLALRSQVVWRTAERGQVGSGGRALLPSGLVLVEKIAHHLNEVLLLLFLSANLFSEVPVLELHVGYLSNCRRTLSEF